MAALRRIIFVALLLLFVSLSVVLSYTNPDPISIDIGVLRFDEVSMALVVAIAFSIGWLFGLVSVGMALFKSGSERRRLRRELQMAEGELRSLRRLPVNDAD